MRPLKSIRNFAIIAHIDHGKSTLADRLLEATQTVSPRKMREQFLDSLDLERERGITIKLKAVRMAYSLKGDQYTLNLIDTPGHVDFTYEVSRSLAAGEGAILLVDAAKGIQAQTLANVTKAQELGLTILPIVNKIDLTDAIPERTAEELISLLGFTDEEILFTSGKTGAGIDELLEAIITRIPPPAGDSQAPLRLLVFDSHYDDHLGVVAAVRVVDGELSPPRTGTNLYLLGSQTEFAPREIGYLTPGPVPSGQLLNGEIGYLATGLKEIARVGVGDTITTAATDPKSPSQLKLKSKTEPEPKTQPQPLHGYRPPTPVVFLSLFPEDADRYPDLKKALERLQLNDAALAFSSEVIGGLGKGFRGGFLGLLHAEITLERLEREANLAVATTTPTVAYQLIDSQDKTTLARCAADFPDFSQIKKVLEPWVMLTVYTPEDYLGAILDLVQKRRGILQTTTQLGQGAFRRLKIKIELPLSELITNFYDQLKSKSSGFASLDYTWLGYRPADVVILRILVADREVAALSRPIIRRQAEAEGRRVVTRLKEILPREQFPVALQAAVGGKIIARETIAARRKNVTGKLYGGDRTRKDKLLQKQKEGKKKLRRLGSVQIPKDKYWEVLRG